MFANFRIFIRLMFIKTSNKVAFGCRTFYNKTVCRMNITSKFKNNLGIVSFDVKRLFTSICVDFVMDVILKEIYGSDLNKKFMV